MAGGLSANPVWWVGLGLCGLGVGIIGGMFGVGGNFLLIPLLNVVFGVPIDIAVGTSLCQIIGTGVAALRRHQRLKQGEIKVDWIMIAGSLMGAQAGAVTLAHLSASGTTHVFGHAIPVVKLWISLIYIGLLSFVALWMIADSKSRGSDAPLRVGPLAKLPLPPFTELPNSERRAPVFVLAYLGLMLGYLSGLVGMGGGVVLMPILIYGFGMRVRMAAGTGILALVASAVAGTYAHARLGHVNLPLAMILLMGSTVGASIGATLTQRIDGRRLRGLFGYLVLITALGVLWDLWRVINRG